MEKGITKITIFKSYGELQRIIKEHPEEIRTNLTTSLYRRLVRSRLSRYNDMDYVFTRAAVPAITIMSRLPRAEVTLKVVTYWIRASHDPRIVPFAKQELVFRVDWKEPAPWN